MNDQIELVENIFKNELLVKGILLNDLQLQQFRSYFSFLVDWNERMNLTNITDIEGVYFKHFYDSISLSFSHDMSSVRKILDIGPGAGFPSMPLKICFPHLDVTMVETLNKRVNFLNALCSETGLTNVVAVHARIEDLGGSPLYRNQFDLVTARAVSKLSTLLEISIPFLNQNGFFISLKGPDVIEEIKLADRAIKLLNAKLCSQSPLDLPFNLGKRTVLKFSRIGKVENKYPRTQGLPFNKPL